MSERMLVTGGYGFIGSEFIRRTLARGGISVVNVDVETYAGDQRRLAEVSGSVVSHRVDIADEELVDIARDFRPRQIVHFAAETHVTRSETQGDLFHRTNVAGTQRVLEAAEAADAELVIHVSTDEVYGPCYGEPYREEDKEPGTGRATSPYARSKALADDLARSWADRLPVVVVRPTNCYGPWQHPEKAIPRWTIRALRGEPVPVWGTGDQVRDWMHVADACAGIELLLDRAVPGQAYNLGPEGQRQTNLQIARLVVQAAGRDQESVYLTEYDRPDHDVRYAVDSSRLQELGWKPTTALEEGIATTVAWYREHEDWWHSLRSEAEQLYSDAAGRVPVE